MKAERLYIMNGPRRVADRERAAAQWKTILAWPAETAMTYHDTLGTAFTPGARQALAQAVQAVKQG
jgi:hypothetical protein